MRRREKAREGGRRRAKAGGGHQHVPAVLNEITALYVSTTGCGTPAAVGAAARPLVYRKAVVSRAPGRAVATAVYLPRR